MVTYWGEEICLQGLQSQCLVCQDDTRQQPGTLEPRFSQLSSVGPHPNSWADCVSESSNFTTASVLQAAERWLLREGEFLPGPAEPSENQVGMVPWQGSRCSSCWVYGPSETTNAHSKKRGKKKEEPGGRQ